MTEIVVAPDTEALGAEAAARVAASARAAVRASGRCALAVSGGSSPAGMFAALATSGLEWSAIHVFQVDERVAPDGHEARNARLLCEALLDRVAIPPANVHLMPVTAADLAAGAAGYGHELWEVTGDGVLDVVHLGLGDDGHTASWPPGDPVADLHAGPDVAVVGPFNGRLRMTLTPPAVNRARRIVWLVDGEGKAPMVRRLLDADMTIPAGRVRSRGAVLVVSAEAAPPLP